MDAKASFAFTLQSAALGVAVALSADTRMFGALEGPWQNITYIVACFSLICGAGCSMWVVIPRLRMIHVRKEWPDNFIYFGHLKFWEAENLQEKIREADMLTVVSNQIVRMSKIAWAKHIVVKISMILASIGGLSLLLCAVLLRTGITW
ncbi:Pycsar system effector family protein [Arthrobacter sp. MDT2-2]